VELLEGQAAVTEPPASGEKEGRPSAPAAREEETNLKERTLTE
jgi:hypothetical protein